MVTKKNKYSDYGIFPLQEIERDRRQDHLKCIVLTQNTSTKYSVVKIVPSTQSNSFLNNDLTDKALITYFWLQTGIQIRLDKSN